MKKTLLLLFFLPVFFAGKAQVPPELDSLVRAIPAMPEDSLKVMALMNTCQMYWSVAPPEAVQYAEQALALSEKIGWKKGVANCNGVLGATYINLADFPKAIEYLNRSKDMSRELNDLAGLARSYGAIGNAYYFQSDFPNALDAYLQGVKIGEQKNDQDVIAGNLSNIGAIYLDLGKYTEALDYFEKARKLNEANGNEIYLAANLSNIGSIYTQLKDPGKAMEFYKQSIALNEKNGDFMSVGSDYVNVGNIYKEQGDIDKALEFIRKSMTLNREFMSPNVLAYAYTAAGEVYLSVLKNNNQNALAKYFSGDRNRCLQAAKTCADSSVILNTITGELNHLKNAYKLLSDVQALQGNHLAALESYQQYASLKDSVFNMEEDRKLVQATMQYEFDKKEAAAKSEQEKKDIRQRNIRNSIAAGLTGALLFLLVVYRQRNRIAKEKQRAEELLLNILPEEVADELREKGSADAKMIDEVTVLFSDFKDFTQLSETVSPRELVAEINECFSEFDRIMTEFGVEKIKTIGDAYMAAGGLPTPNSTHAQDVVRAALKMQQFMSDRRKVREAAGKLFFEIRIGVHTGPVVAGIVGLKKFAYDIWGDTVNTANRMESSGETGKVNISGATYEQVKNLFACTHRGKVQAKGKGEIDMYFVEMT